VCSSDLAPLPHLLNSVGMLLFSGDDASRSNDPIRMVVWLLGAWIPTIAVLAYLMWSRRESWERFGFPRARLRIDIPLAFAVFIVWWITFVASAWVFYFVGVWRIDEMLGVYDAYADREIAMPALWFWGPLVAAHLVNAIAEEWVFRSYLLTRLRDEGVSVVGAIVISSGIFASYHIYQGVGSMLEIFVGACVMCTMFVFIKRIWPFILTHAAWNLSVVALYGV